MKNYRFRRIKKVINFFGRLGMIANISLACFIAMFIPVIIIGNVMYRSSVDLAFEKTVSSSKQIMHSARTDITKRAEIARKVAVKLSQQPQIVNYLMAKKYNDESEIFDAEFFVQNFLNYSLDFVQSGIYQVSIYFFNPYQKEHGFFYKADSVSQHLWFSQFMNNDKDEKWYYPFNPLRYGHETHKHDDVFFRFIKKIRNIDNQVIGVAVVDVLEEDMLSLANINEGLGGDLFFVLDLSANLLNRSAGLSYGEMNRIRKNINSQNDSFILDGNVYTYEVLKPLELILVLRKSLQEFKETTYRNLYRLLFGAAAGFIFVEGVIIFIIKWNLGRIKKGINVLNVAAKGNFNIRIPEGYDDETGKILSDMNSVISALAENVESLVKKETAHKDAQLTALQFQINSHFIYNTIDSFRMRLQLQKDYELADAISFFGKMIRYNVSNTAKFVTLKEETEYVEKYCLIQKIRYGDKIRIMIDLPENLKNYKIMKFMLQPVVENSLKHGFDGENVLVIKIWFEIKGSSLLIFVEDNGLGINLKHLQKLNYKFKYSAPYGHVNYSAAPNYEKEQFSSSKVNNIGLDNINNRIKLFYGEQYYIKLESIPGEFTRTVITIPYVV